MIDHIKKLIQKALPDAQTTVIDPMNDGQHFEAIVKSAQFEGLPLVKQHRIVMDALKKYFDSEELHALRLKTLPLKTKKIISWNVNGLRSVLKKGFIESVKKMNPDILCLQEVRSHESDLPKQWMGDLVYHTYFCPAEKKGYSGVATFSKEKAEKVETMGNESFDQEGRVQVLHFSNHIIINAYFPNSRAERARIAYKLDFCTQLIKLSNRYRKEKNVIICGDYNVAHRAIDLKRPEQNEDSPGYYIEERNWMTSFLEEGYVDVFRTHNPEKTDQYTWWSYRSNARSRNVGWRIDYHVVNKEFMPKVLSSSILFEVKGSDHCPVSLSIED